MGRPAEQRAPAPVDEDDEGALPTAEEGALVAPPTVVGPAPARPTSHVSPPSKEPSNVRAMPTEKLPDDVRPRTLLGPGCWYWTGPTANRYDASGQLVRRAVLPRRTAVGKWRTTTTARAVLELALGRPLEAGELALHTCDEPLCVRPSHLYAGDARDNMADALRRGRIVTAGRRPQVRPQAVDSARPRTTLGGAPTR